MTFDPYLHDQHFHQWKNGAHGPCVRHESTGRDLAGHYASCDCGAEIFIGRYDSDGRYVGLFWPSDKRDMPPVEVPIALLGEMR